MTDDLDIITVPQPEIQVLTESISVPVVIESAQIEVVVSSEDVVIVDTIHETSIVTVGEQGPSGTTDHLALSNVGTNTHAEIDSFIAGPTWAGDGFFSKQILTNLSVPDGYNYVQLSRLIVEGRLELLGSARVGIL